jgi:hypothetical protein
VSLEPICWISRASGPQLKSSTPPVQTSVLSVINVHATAELGRPVQFIQDGNANHISFRVAPCSSDQYVASKAIARGQSQISRTLHFPSWYSFRTLRVSESMASTGDYKTASLDVEENAEKASPDGLQNVGHHHPSGLEVRAS